MAATPTQAPIAPAASPSLPSTITEDSQLPTVPFLSTPTTTPPPPQGVVASADIDMTPPTFSMPGSSLSGADKEKALRPLLHNATAISVQPAPLPVPISRPLVHELYAQAFAFLPTIHTFYGLLIQKAQSLYDYLFNPAVVPAKEVDTVSDTPDAPMTDATTGETPPTPMLSALYTLFAPLSSSPCCPCVYFSSSDYVVRGDTSFIYLTLPLLRILINPLHSALFPLMRLSRPFELPGKHTNTAATHGGLISLILILLLLTNISLFTVPHTMESPLHLCTTRTQ